MIPASCTDASPRLRSCFPVSACQRRWNYWRDHKLNLHLTYSHPWFYDRLTACVSSLVKSEPAEHIHIHIIQVVTIKIRSFVRFFKVFLHWTPGSITSPSARAQTSAWHMSDCCQHTTFCCVSVTVRCSQTECGDTLKTEDERVWILLLAPLLSHSSVTAIPILSLKCGSYCDWHPLPLLLFQPFDLERG